MNRTALLAAIAALVLAAGAAYYFLVRQTEAPAAEVVTPPPVTAPEQPATAAPEVHHPVPPSESTAAVPATLADSDTAIRQSLLKAFGKTPLDGWLIPQHIIRSLVVTINGLDGDPVAIRLRPIAHVPGLPAVEGEGGDVILSPDNSARYTPYIALLNKVSGKTMAAVYLHYYPLFQRAYEELGYHGKYFNDRLVKIIDHLLATPTIEAPIKLLRPKVLYEYADTTLELRSWGQKLLIRMGPENAAVVKARLREIRAAVIAEAPAKG